MSEFVWSTIVVENSLRTNNRNSLAQIRNVFLSFGLRAGLVLSTVSDSLLS